MLMDSMRYPTPQLRLVYALALAIRFATAVVSRATVEYAAEQHPLLPQVRASARVSLHGGVRGLASILAIADGTAGARGRERRAVPRGPVGARPLLAAAACHADRGGLCRRARCATY